RVISIDKFLQITFDPTLVNANRYVYRPAIQQVCRTLRRNQIKRHALQGVGDLVAWTYQLQTIDRQLGRLRLADHTGSASLRTWRQKSSVIGRIILRLKRESLQGIGPAEHTVTNPSDLDVVTVTCA